jgi:hypothetical protein
MLLNKHFISIVRLKNSFAHSVERFSPYSYSGFLFEAKRKLKETKREITATKRIYHSAQKQPEGEAMNFIEPYGWNQLSNGLIVVGIIACLASIASAVSVGVVGTRHRRKAKPQASSRVVPLLAMRDSLDFRH